MNSNRTRATIVGILILVAYSMLASAATDIKWVVTLLDIVSGLAVIGTAMIMFPFFKVSNRQLSIGYTSLKLLEGTLMIAAGVFFLSDSFQGWHAWIYNYPQTYVFIVSAFLFYILLLKTELVPCFISIWGIVAVFTLLIANVTKSLGVNSPALDALMALIITNEVFLAIWLMVKGFNPTAITSASAKQD